MIRVLKLTVVAVFGLGVLALLALWIGASMSLDRSYSHTRASAALPAFQPGTSQRLVQIAASGLIFRARIGGFDNPAPKGDLLLLHGFPETSVMYQPLIEAATREGYRVVAFDQRGYSPGARPEGRSSYGMAELTADALAVADAVGFTRFHLVGHDWGAAVGWQLAFEAPERLLTYGALSIPHVAAFAAAIAKDPEQQSRSSYMAFFWLPRLPEQTFAINDLAALRELYAGHPANHLEEYLAVFGEPGAMTGALNWYRAAADGPAKPVGNVSLPILFIRGNEDIAVGRTAVEGQEEFIEGPFESLELDTGHWLMATATEAVVEAVLDHLDRYAVSRSGEKAAEALQIEGDAG